MLSSLALAPAATPERMLATLGLLSRVGGARRFLPQKRPPFKWYPTLLSAKPKLGRWGLAKGVPGGPAWGRNRAGAARHPATCALWIHSRAGLGAILERGAAPASGHVPPCAAGGVTCETLDLSEQALVFFDAHVHISQDFAQQRPPNVSRTMVRDHRHGALGISKRVVAANATRPMKTSGFSDFLELTIRNNTQFAQAVTSTNMVPT